MEQLSEALSFLKEHIAEATLAAGIFGLGWLFSVFVVKWNVRELMRFPLWFVDKLMGWMPPHSSSARIFFVIFSFNTVAMFLYMISGALIIAPVIIDFLTGMHVGIVMFAGGLSQLPAAKEHGAPDAPDPARPPGPDGEESIHIHGPTILAALCGLLVVVLELPALWLSIAMGMSIGYGIREEGFMRLASPCVQAFCVVIVPVLATSAVAETVAIRSAGDIRKGQ